MTQVSIGKTERMRELGDTREMGMSTVVPVEQALRFALLVTTDVGSSATSTKLANDSPLLESLTEQLAPHFQGSSQWPLQVVLYVPRLGRIKASIRREPGVWSVELDAECDRTTSWLCGIRQRCQERIANTLGQPVDLTLVHMASA
ncbi:type III secretion system HrpP C-terminal domain-containing protein [Pseudomonas allii]|uniref:Type III secretion system HrpP C-terminal domain-containing protein n=2 Tax=Pseudomonas allii TaxID=2740531 RepID=A0ACC6LET0_9PSED|nr:type III secretion system HrpP C-terminal domain-containing protein [Pseudomonas allii]MDR9876804.1 type III secretion system HrpP C-terminal domain-containing protein [Pseudomonas allii]NWN48429.1 flagellar hook-length control protein FliK [Pseudomonas allii]NWN63272.1 flagellar hook-length control protein FliK [Pseudomonas allii]